MTFAGMDEPEAHVEVQNGQEVLVDPTYAAVSDVAKSLNRGRAKEDCRTTFHHSADRVLYFARRIRELGKSPTDVMVVLIYVDDPHGRLLADELMPGHDWASIRATGALPYARGLVARDSIQEVVDLIDSEVGARLREMDQGPVVLVVDFGTCEVFYASEAENT